MDRHHTSVPKPPAHWVPGSFGPLAGRAPSDELVSNSAIPRSNACCFWQPYASLPYSEAQQRCARFLARSTYKILRRRAGGPSSEPGSSAPATQGTSRPLASQTTDSSAKGKARHSTQMISGSKAQKCKESESVWGPFDDSERYGGYMPGRQYFRDSFDAGEATKLHQREYFNIFMASLIGETACGDHFHKPSKLVHV
ncbi:TPA: hypothetical protein ACH3X2_013353 [Trebouxia sp. C0005]